MATERLMALKKLHKVSIISSCADHLFLYFHVCLLILFTDQLPKRYHYGPNNQQHEKVTVVSIFTNAVSPLLIVGGENKEVVSNNNTSKTESSTITNEKVSSDDWSRASFYRSSTISFRF